VSGSGVAPAAVRSAGCAFLRLRDAVYSVAMSFSKRLCRDIFVGILPKPVAVALLEPYGLMILIGLLIILPMLSAQLGVNLNYISGAFAIATRTIINGILYRLKLCESATCKLQMMGSAAQHSKAIAQNPAGPKCANSQPESMVKSAVAPPIPTVP
jgi:hypothetical protein